jgi:hypothetical protein
MFGGVRMGLMGTPMSGPYSQGGFDTVGSGGGMDAMDSLKKHQDFGTRFATNPTGGMGGFGGVFGSTGGMNYGGMPSMGGF